jgi:hypothetical protein
MREPITRYPLQAAPIVLVLSETVLVLVIESRRVRMITRLTRMAMKYDRVSESMIGYDWGPITSTSTAMLSTSTR